MPDHGVPNLAENLNFLFAHIPGPTGKQLSNHQASEALQDAGISASSAYLSQLRSGARNNPSAMLVAGLANLFGVRVDYFFDDSVNRDTKDEVQAVAALRDKHIRGVFTRSAGVTRQGLASALERVLQDLQKAEDDPRDEDDPPNPSGGRSH